MADFDAIAVGGGLAGAAFALEAARSGLKTAVVERSQHPHQKVCGDFHSREAAQILASLGLDLTRLGAQPIGTFRLVSGKRTASAPLPFSASGFSRCRLDETLLGAARDAGAEIVRGETVTGLEPGDDAVSLRLGARTLTARRVALATGKHNLRGWQRTRGNLTAFKIVADPTQSAKALLGGVVQLAGYRGGYAGACLVEDGALPVCWLADAAFMKETDGDWRRQLAAISRQAPLFGDLLSGAKFQSAEPAAISAIPFGYMRREPISPDVFPVGDQLAVIPSFTGDGTSLALASGLRAARAVVSGQDAAEYQCLSLAHLRTQFLFARAVHRTFASAGLRAISIGAITVMPRLATAIAELTRTAGIESLLAPSAPAGRL